jgi:hypothetical protein
MIEQWTVDGTDLVTLAFGVSVVTAGRGIPPIRGQNLIIPFRHGARAFTKYYGERKLTLAMYVLGADPLTGEMPGNDIERDQLFTNLEALRQLFGRRNTLLDIILTNNVAVRHAKVEVIGTMDFASINAGGLCEFAVEMIMPDPFWYGTEIAPTFSWTSTPASWTVNHPGTVDTVKMVIDIVGDAQNPKLVLGDGTGTFVQLLATGGGADVLEIDTDAYTATKNAANIVGSLRHTGDPAFFKLHPGDNTITLTSDVPPTADVTITFEPPYL